MSLSNKIDKYEDTNMRAEDVRECFIELIETMNHIRFHENPILDEKAITETP